MRAARRFLPFPVPRKMAAGFTLVEVMVAMAVLVIIGVMLAEIISATSQTTILSNRNVDAAAQARIAYDRMQLDFANILNRWEVDFVGQNSPSEAVPPVPLLQFFSAVRSPGIADKNGRSNNRGISLLSYEIRSHADNPDSARTPRLCLTRAGMPVPWDAKPYTFNGSSVNWGNSFFMGLKSNGLPVRMDDGVFFPASLLPTPTDFDVLAPGVIRMVVGFQLYPEGSQLKLDGRTGTTRCRGQVVYGAPLRELEPKNAVGTKIAYQDISYISALVIGIVALDAESLRQMSAQNVQDLAAVFPLPADGSLPVQAWSSIASNPNALPASVPPRARQALRIYQRAFPINPYKAGD